jgi:hypothetical protein
MVNYGTKWLWCKIHMVRNDFWLWYEIAILWYEMVNYGTKWQWSETAEPNYTKPGRVGPWVGSSQNCIRQSRPLFKMAAVTKNRNFFRCPLLLYYKPCQVWFNLVQRFQRKRFKCDLLSKYA